MISALSASCHWSSAGRSPVVALELKWKETSGGCTAVRRRNEKQQSPSDERREFSLRRRGAVHGQIDVVFPIVKPMNNNCLSFLATTDAPRCRTSNSALVIGVSKQETASLECQVDTDPSDVHFWWTFLGTPMRSKSARVPSTCLCTTSAGGRPKATKANEWPGPILPRHEPPLRPLLDLTDIQLHSMTGWRVPSQ